MSKEKTKMILQTCITLASAALGLVAALAWNDAIKAAMKEVLGEGESVGALFVYAIVVGLIVTLAAVAKIAARKAQSSMIGSSASAGGTPADPTSPIGAPRSSNRSTPAPTGSSPAPCAGTS